jgi:hypothetical protein
MMRAMPRKVETLLEVCTARAVRARGGNPARAFDALRAVPQAMRACGLVIAWAMASAYGTNGRVAFGREYADYWRCTERQAWRDRARIRELFEPSEFEQLITSVAAQLLRRGVVAPSDELMGIEIDVDELVASDVPSARVRRDHATVA